MEDNESELVEEFVLESSSGLRGIEQDLLALEETGAQPATINNIFRAIHTIKSSSGYLGLENIQRVAHLTETLLDQIRQGERAADSACVDVLLRSVDVLLAMVESSDLGASQDVSEILARLDELVAAAAPPAFEEEKVTVAQSRDLLVQLGADTEVLVRGNAAYREGKALFLVKVDATGAQSAQEALAELGEVLLCAPQKGGLLLSTVLDAQMICMSLNMESSQVVPVLREAVADAQLAIGGTPRPQTAASCPIPSTPSAPCPASAAPVLPAASAGAITERTIEPDPKPVVAPKPALAVAAQKTMPAGEPVAPAKSIPAGANGVTENGHDKAAPDEGQMMKINVRLLDELLRFTGNMVMSRNQLLTRYNFADDQAFATLSQAITEVHRNVVQTRMESVGTMFGRFKRIVRDLAKKLGKNVELVVQGGEMELDRTIVETFIDPMTHMVRNCVDHAIEMPDERRASAKPHMGKVTLRAYQESGEIIIAVQDDGRGIDPARVKKKAIEKGVVSQRQADEMSDAQALMLIFEPGFSTAEKITDVSGRGVGMDVVRTNIEKIGGVVDVESEVGVGTTFHARLPLTKAMVTSSLISALIIKAGSQRFCIPQSAVNELITILPREFEQKVRLLQGQRVFQHRELILPLITLQEALGLGAEEAPDPAQPRTLIVLQHRQNLFGLLVDCIIGIEEAVVRDMPALVKASGVFSGHSVLGDGQVVMIIDISGIVERMQMRFIAKVTDAPREKMPALSVGRRADRQTMIIFNYAHNEFFAIPLELVSLVEKIPAKEIRTVGPRSFYPRKGDTIPLLYLDKHLPITQLDRTLPYYNLIIPARVKFPIGLITNSDIRVAEISEHFDEKITSNKGILGTFMYNDKLVMLLDLYALFEHDAPEHFDTAIRDQGHAARILIVEDSLFYRRLNATYLATPQRQLTVACDGKEALTILRSNPGGFDVVVTDIEMPVMDGFELVKSIRSDPLLRDLPVIALTALQDERSRARGREAGFTEYVIKVDKDSLISCVNRYTNPAERRKLVGGLIPAGGMR